GSPREYTARLVSCAGTNTILSLVEGSLDSEERERLLKHAESCPDCRALLVGMMGSGPPASSEVPPVALQGAPTTRPAPPAPTDPASGIDRFIVLERIGAGGMGVIVAAYDPDLDRKVAIKLLRPDRAGADASARLVREARSMARLAHPNVITVHEVGLAGEQVFIAMEHVEGGTLRTWLDGGPRPWPAVRDLFARAGQGLAAAHAAGIVHRDFKPENVLVGADGRVRVTDFGLAAAPAEATGTVAGTPRY